MSAVEFNSEREEFKPAAAEAVSEGVRTLAIEYQKVLDSVLKSSVGKPLDDVRAALWFGWQGVAGADLTEPALTQYATRIRNGTRIVVKPDQI